MAIPNEGTMLHFEGSSATLFSPTTISILDAIVDSKGMYSHRKLGETIVTESSYHTTL